ncbi:hypothetical protein Q0F98_16220 [Paenibacillus amylolyticus]|nr:hypothetical protein Q0F98_16220 [Paenibacillus amylolyticus]
MSIYLVWRTFFTLPWGEGVLNVIFGMLLIVAETVTVLTTFELFFQKMQKERTQLDFPIVPPEYYPDVDVFIATIMSLLICYIKPLMPVRSWITRTSRRFISISVTMEQDQR